MAEPREPLSELPTASADALAPTMAGVPPGAAATSHPGAVDAGDTPLDESGFAERYHERSLLGAGGMGEVQLCKDRRIGREVAVKVARAASGSRGDAVARFAREARVQGQLEHPAIVPVYDLGRRPDGAVFFTMKRVRGLTLERIVDGLRRGDADMARVYTRRKLLTAFDAVCQAIHFAHTRGVLHRDLKPGNIMLGDFGEVYVLDWGLAKLVGEDDQGDELGASGPADDDVRAAGTPAPERIDASSTPGPATTSGAVMGTPGYMAPEQIRGEIERLDARADIYALGALLYELLTWQPLHRRDNIAQTMASTLDGADARACTRVPERDVPPELEAVCVRATALQPADRYASARELFDAIERFLDGDRDLERRRELADGAAVAAEAAADRALASGAEPERREALAHAGRALALDPENAGAMRTMIRLLLAPPRTLPGEVERELVRRETEMVRVASVQGGWTYLSWFLFVPFLFWMGLRDARPLAVWLPLMLCAAAIGFLGSRTRYADVRLHFTGVVLSSVGIVLMAPIFGPFILVPVIASVNTIGFLLHARPEWRLGTVLMGAATVVFPVVAELLGWMPRTTFFVDDSIVIRSWTVHLPETATLVVLASALVGCIVIPGLYVLRVREALVSAERNLQLQSWHLRQLIPAEARAALAPKLAEPAPLLTCPIDGQPITLRRR